MASEEDIDKVIAQLVSGEDLLPDVLTPLVAAVLRADLTVSQDLMSGVLDKLALMARLPAPKVVFRAA